MSTEKRLFWGAIYLALLLIALVKIVGGVKIVVLVAPEEVGGVPAIRKSAASLSLSRALAGPVNGAVDHVVKTPAGGIAAARRVNR